MGEDKAYETFCGLRWPETEGEAVCPRFGCVETYNITSRCRFKCIPCHHQFSVTSGTIFASRKLSFTDLLAAIVIFLNGAKGVSALQVSRDLDVQYKTAFVLRTSCARQWRGSRWAVSWTGLSKSTVATSVATPSPKTANRIARTAACSRTAPASANASLSCASAAVSHCPSLSATRVMPFPMSAIMSARWRLSLPTRALDGTHCTRDGIRNASITA